MTEAEFRARAEASGFADFQVKPYVADFDVELHVHEFAVTLLVLEGEFGLQYEDRKDTFRVGEVCDLAPNVLHGERAGAQGATILLAKKGHRP